MNVSASTPCPASARITTLFVAWRDPRSQGYFPIGRLRLREGADPYEFRYTHGVDAACARGFRPLVGLDDMHGVYRSDELFPVFANRVPSSKRVDRREYISAFDLDPDTAEPFQILAISGGRRVTDTLEVIPAPQRDVGSNTYETVIFLHGLRHVPREAQERVLALRTGERLCVVLDVQNSFDPGAIALRTSDSGSDRWLVGYLPRYIRSDAWRLLGGCGGPHASIEVHVRRVNPPPAPLDQRLLCNLHASWPDGFTPFADPQYQPIVPDEPQVANEASHGRGWNGAAKR